MKRSIENKDGIKNIDWAVLLSTIIIVGVALAFLILYKRAAEQIVESLLQIITYNLGWVYIVAQICGLIFAGWLILGSVKNKVIGGNDAARKYSEFSWAAMIICTGIAGATLVLAFVEPLWYLTDTPFSIEPLSEKAFEYSHMYIQFHWGFMTWIPYVPTSILLAYLIHNKGVGKEKFSIICKKTNGIWAKLVDVLAIIAITGGVGTSMGLCVPLIVKMLEKIFGLETQNNIYVFVYLFLVCVFITSVWRGLDNGIKKLSDINILLALLLVTIVFVCANPLRVIEVELNSIGIQAKEFFHMLFYTASYDGSSFPQRWTVFYWAWFYAYIPLMALFIAKISGGRSVRHITLGILGYGSLGELAVFIVFGCYSLDLQKKGIINLVEVLGSEGREETVINILGELPFSGAISCLFVFVSILFLATTIDSAAFVLSMMSSHSLNVEKQPSRALRLIWAFMLALIAIVLSMTGGLSTIQTVSILTGFPMIFMMFICIRKIIRIRNSW